MFYNCGHTITSRQYTILSTIQGMALFSTDNVTAAVDRDDRTAVSVLIQDVVSGDVLWWFQTINFAIICELIDVLGSVANIINVICFCKQGFKDSVNISLLGLAISDLGCLITLMWECLCINQLFNQADLPFEALEVQYITGGWPHVMFTRVTSWITAFITLERCLCITMPLKVKTIITPKRVTVTIASIFIILLASVSPVYYANRLGWKFYPNKNKTLVGLVYSPDRESIEKVSFAVNNLFVSFAAFLSVIACTITLVVKLRQKTKWRVQVIAPVTSNAFSNRDQKVCQMIVMISTLFIVCFTPVTIAFIGMIIWPEFSITGRYKNMFFVVFSFGFTMESANSSMNIFIYYRMSSKYRAVFRTLFHMDTNKISRG